MISYMCPHKLSVLCCYPDVALALRNVWDNTRNIKTDDRNKTVV